jgi:hypothetical protein
MTQRGVRQGLAALVLVAAVVLCFGCENTTPTAEQREEIEGITKGYLNDLAEAYSSMDVSELGRHASRREIDEVYKLLEKLSKTGDRLEATLLLVEVQDVEVFRRVNATVKLVEVWDVGRYDAFNGREKGRNPRSVQQSVIQLRVVDSEWKVIGRRVMETERGSAWGVKGSRPNTSESTG